MLGVDCYMDTSLPVSVPVRPGLSALTFRVSARVESRIPKLPTPGESDALHTNRGNGNGDGGGGDRGGATPTVGAAVTEFVVPRAVAPTG